MLDKAELSPSVGALRLRLVAARGTGPARIIPDKDAAGAYPPEVLLDLDYWAAIPRAKV